MTWKVICHNVTVTGFPVRCCCMTPGALVVTLAMLLRLIKCRFIIIIIIIIIRCPGMHARMRS